MEQDLTSVANQEMPERVREEETRGTTEMEVREATKIRRLAEHKKEGPRCIVCGNCVCGGTHRVGGGECEDSK